MNTEFGIAFPNYLSSPIWNEAISGFANKDVLSKDQLRNAVIMYVEKHQLYEVQRTGAIRKIVNLFRAQILLCVRAGHELNDVEEEYRSVRPLLFRISNFDMDMPFCLDDLNPRDLREVLEIAKELTASQSSD